MKLATVVPPGSERALPVGLDAYFAFAPDLVADTDYASYFMGRPNLIIDCPIYEEENRPISPNAWAILADIFQPTFLIIPDVRGEATGTLAKAHPYLARSAAPCATGVVQGSTIEECLSCAREFYSSGVRRFAIPKDLKWRTEWFRSDIIKALQQIIGEAPIHLLGADWPYQDEALIAHRFPQVLSVDTAEPTNAAMMGNRLAPRQPRTRPDNWRNLSPLVYRNEQTFRSNVGWLRNKLNGG